MVFHVALAKAEDGWIVAECPAVPGCVSQGKDEQEALANIKEAIAGEGVACNFSLRMALPARAACTGNPGKSHYSAVVRAGLHHDLGSRPRAGATARMAAMQVAMCSSRGMPNS
jgi:hypothetical protein